MIDQGRKLSSPPLASDESWQCKRLRALGMIKFV